MDTAYRNRSRLFTQMLAAYRDLNLPAPPRRSSSSWKSTTSGWRSWTGSAPKTPSFWNVLVNPCYEQVGGTCSRYAMRTAVEMVTQKKLDEEKFYSFFETCGEEGAWLDDSVRDFRRFFPGSQIKFTKVTPPESPDELKDLLDDIYDRKKVYMITVDYMDLFQHGDRQVVYPGQDAHAIVMYGYDGDNALLRNSWGNPCNAYFKMSGPDGLYGDNDMEIKEMFLVETSTFYQGAYSDDLTL